jgi:hypothetical protein
MRITGMMVLTGLGLGVLGAQSMAQQSNNFTLQQLQQMWERDQQGSVHRNWGPPPPQSSVPSQHLSPPSGLVVCMSIDEWQPIYAAPSRTSSVIGRTLQEVAVKGASERGFVPILFGPGRTGYVSASEIRPFRSTIKPGLTCNVEVRPDGAPVFVHH